MLRIEISFLNFYTVSSNKGRIEFNINYTSKNCELHLIGFFRLTLYIWQAIFEEIINFNAENFNQ